MTTIAPARIDREAVENAIAALLDTAADEVHQLIMALPYGEAQKAASRASQALLGVISLQYAVYRPHR
jgi:hypothetical protein